MKKLKNRLLIKPYKCYLSIGLLIFSIAAYLISKTALYENNPYVKIIIGLIVKNLLWLVITALLILAIFIVENMLAQRISNDEERSDVT